MRTWFHPVPMRRVGYVVGGGQGAGEQLILTALLSGPWPGNARGLVIPEAPAAEATTPVSSPTPMIATMVKLTRLSLVVRFSPNLSFQARRSQRRHGTVTIDRNYCERRLIGPAARNREH